MGKRKEKGRGNISLYESLVIAFSMYSRIPVPQVEWTDAGMKYALCFFPLTGAVIGAAEVVFFWLAQRIGLGDMARVCIGTALPLLVTGGIHMDGFLDVTDARSSCQPAERKLEIMKDPHAGAFAIWKCGLYLLLYLAVFGELGEEAFPAMAGIYVLERAMSGWSVVSLPKARTDGLASTFSRGAQKQAVQVTMLFWGMAATGYLFWSGGWRAGISAVAVAFLVFLWYCRMARREFGGITGDLAGYFLQLCELGMLGALAVAL